MNILLANWTWYPSGGDWTYLESICKLYEAKGHTIIPFSVLNENNFETPYSKYFLNKIDYKILDRNRSIKSGIKVIASSIYSIEAKLKIKSLIKENNIDIAQFHYINNYQTPSIIPILHRNKIPMVWRILDYKLICPNTYLAVNDAVCEACFQHKYYNCVIKKCKKGSFLPSIIAALESYIYYVLPYYKYINLFLFQSEFTRDMFVKFGYDIKKTHIIENPYDCKNITPKYEGKNYILYFGRIEKNKGIYTLLKAMESLPDIELKVVGIGTEYQNCLNYISEKRMHNVDFLGAKWNDDLMPIIENCEFVVVPSEWYEPSPYVVLQAFSYGKPVLASNMGGLNDMVKDGNNGILFNAGDDKQLTQKIKYLLSNKALTQKMGTMARKILEDKYNPERYYTDTINIFNDLIKFKNV